MNIPKLIHSLVSLTEKGILQWDGDLSDYYGQTYQIHCANYKKARMEIWFTGCMFFPRFFHSLRLKINDEIIASSKKPLKPLHRVIKDQLRSKEEREQEENEEEAKRACKSLIEFNEKTISN